LDSGGGNVCINLKY